jgi:Sigma-70 region 2
MSEARERMERLESAALAMRAGEIDDGEFVRQTAYTWRRESARLFGRWRRRLPAWVEAADVEQEMCLQALYYVRQWDPAVGSRIGPHVVWCAVKRAQRRINKWRGASLHGDASRNPSHFELAATRAFRARGDEEEVEIGTRVPTPGVDPVERIEASERFDSVLQSCETVREALVLLALRACEGSMERAARALYEDVHARAKCGLTDERHARRVVGSAISSICDTVERAIVTSAA